MHWKKINKTLGNIDIYWLDFILKGHLAADSKLLDVGCGEGRNIQYLLAEGYDVYGVDINPLAIDFIRLFARSKGVVELLARFQQMNATKLLFPSNTFDCLISSAVLHFMDDEEQFWRAIKELHRVLKPGGKLFMRSMTSHAFPEELENVKLDFTQKIELPNGEHRFLINNEAIDYLTSSGLFKWVEPFKYVVLPAQRSMGVFILEKI